jgi:hypothetical protein
MQISAWAIRKPIPSIVLFIVLMILGIFSFRQLPVTRFPNIDIPIISVTVTQAGAAPSELQNQVTKRIEDAIAGLTGVKHIISTIAEGVSTTTIEFRLETNSDRATWPCWRAPGAARRQGHRRADGGGRRAVGGRAGAGVPGRPGAHARPRPRPGRPGAARRPARGPAHHSDWSDGGSPIEEMAWTARGPRPRVRRPDRPLTPAHGRHGLTPERLRRQLGVVADRRRGSRPSGC